MSPGKKKSKKSLMAKKQEEKKISKKEKVISREKKDSKAKKTTGKKSGRKVVPGWGLTRGVHPPRCDPSMMTILRPTSSQPAW